MSTSTTPGTSIAGAVAESVERFRPGYPDEVVDRTLSYAGRPVRTAIEIGAGTGKAARAFASRGVEVTALEPDPHMFAVLERESVGQQVRPVPTSLDAYTGPAADLVYAASSWHLATPGTRCTRAAELLVDGGVVAVFETLVRLADPHARAALAESGLPVLEDAALLSEQELVASGRFGDVEEHRVSHRVVMPQREYVGYLSTLASVQHLDVEERAEVLRRTARSLPDQVRLDLSVMLQVARRL